MDKRYKEILANILEIDRLEEDAYQLNSRIPWEETRYQLTILLEACIDRLKDRLKEIN